MIDIILEDDRLKEKLLMTNVKNSKNSEYYEKVIKELKERCQARDEVFEYDVKHTREKFKSCIGNCKDAAMKIKTASGITRFQEDKEYGTWFNKLFNVMETTANFQPEQSIQPDSQNYGSSSDSKEKGTNLNSSTNSGKQEKTNKRKLFVPIHETTKKASKKREESLNRALESSQKSLENDPTREILSLLKEDSERQQQLDERFFTFMERILTTPVTAMQPTPFTFDPASHYYIMQQQSFQTPHHLPQQGRYPQNNREISYDPSNSRTLENI